MIKQLSPEEENDTERYPYIVSFDKSQIYLTTKNKPKRNITILGWSIAILIPCLLFGVFT